MGKNHSKFAPKNLPIQNITVNNIYNNCQINYNAQQNNYNQYNNFWTKKPNSDCYCPICGEEFLKGKFVNSGEKKDYFDCRKCKVHQIEKVNFVLNAQKQIIIYLIIHVLYVENNFYKEKENLLIVVKKKIILIVENAMFIKLTSIILNVKIAKVNFVLNAQK